MEQTDEVIIARGDKVWEEEEATINVPVKKVRKTKSKKPNAVETPVAPPKLRVEDSENTTADKVDDKVEELYDVPSNIVVPNAMEEEEDDVSDNDEEIAALLEEQNKLNRQIQMLENAKKIKKNIKDYRKTLMENRAEKIKKLGVMIDELQAEVTKITGEMEALKDLQDCELADTIVGNTELENELGLNRPVKKKNAKKTKTDDDVSSLTSNDSKKERKSAAIKERKDQWNLIPEGTKLEMTYNKSGRIYTKVGNGLVGADGKQYKSMNDAIKKYKQEIGDEKQFGSAWSLFKVYDDN